MGKAISIPTTKLHQPKIDWVRLWIGWAVTIDIFEAQKAHERLVSLSFNTTAFNSGDFTSLLGT